MTRIVDQAMVTNPDVTPTLFVDDLADEASGGPKWVRKTVDWLHLGSLPARYVRWHGNLVSEVSLFSIDPEARAGDSGRPRRV